MSGVEGGREDVSSSTETSSAQAMSREDVSSSEVVEDVSSSTETSSAQAMSRTETTKSGQIPCNTLATQ